MENVESRHRTENLSQNLSKHRIENLSSPISIYLSSPIFQVNNSYKFKESCLYEIVEELLGPTELKSK